MTELNKYTIHEMMSLPDEERGQYQAYALSLRPNDWQKGDPLEWSWSKVKQLQDILNGTSVTYSGMVEAVSLISEKPEAEILNMPWIDVFPFYNYLVEAVKQINKVEEALRYEPDAKEINAGIEEFARFRWFVTLDRLSGGDPLKYEAIGKMPFADINAKLQLNKLDAEYQKKLIKAHDVRSS